MSSAFTNMLDQNFPGVPAVPELPPIPGLPDVPALPELPSIPGLPDVPPTPEVPGSGKGKWIDEKWAEHTKDLAPEQGFVNGPHVDGGVKLAATPEEAAQHQGIEAPKASEPDLLDSVEKDDLRKFGQHLGCVVKGSKAQAPSLRNTIRLHCLTNKIDITAALKSFLGAPEAAVQPSLPEVPATQPTTPAVPEPPPAPAAQEQPKVREIRAVVKSHAEWADESPFKPSKPISTLYINCAPSSKKARPFSSFLALVSDELYKRSGVADYRYIEFGKGAGLLCECADFVVRQADDAGTDFGDLEVDTATPEGSVLLYTLMGLADEHVRGYR